jgi:tetratricopeptide (TPR) repeat protein
MSESLVRAVELRMTGLSKKMNAEELNRRITDAASDGLFLVPYFVEALLKFEAQDSGMRIYYPQMIEKIDVPREEKRASQITYRTTPAQRSLSEFSESRQASASTDDLESLLAEGEDAMARHDIIEARKAYRAALDAVANAGANTDPQLNASGRARALYGLALAATEAKQAEVAKTFFQQTLEVAREPQLLAWSHIYLGRLLDMENHRDQALRHYRQALESGDIAPNVRLAAQKGLETQFTKPKEN